MAVTDFPPPDMGEDEEGVSSGRLLADLTDFFDGDEDEEDSLEMDMMGDMEMQMEEEMDEMDIDGEEWVLRCHHLLML